MGRREGKSSQSKLGPHVCFAQLSVEHLLDAWPLDWGLLPGAGEKRESLWAPHVSARNNARGGCGSGPGHREEGEPGSSPLPRLFLPLLFLPPGCVFLAPPLLLINSSHTSLLSLAFHWRVPSPSEEQMLSPIVSPPARPLLTHRTFHSAPLPPARRPGPLDTSPKATAPHPTLNQLPVL